MQGIRKSLLQLCFSGSCMLRWNDKLRPTELWEIDKQGHKMILAFVLCHERGLTLPLEERLQLEQQVVEGGLFDYFYRLIITDLKPPVFYRIKKNTAHFQQLTDFVLARLEPAVRPLGEEFWQRLCHWHRNEHQGDAARILDAAHWYSSRWEFNILKDLNRAFDEEIPDIASQFEEYLDSCRNLAGMDQILDANSALGRFANFCGQLRFQIRWTQAPRIPPTSVLGHMFLVATYAYFASLTVEACPARRINNFFCGLLHDLPELLTRDIISPVKKSVDHLSEIIRQYEEDELERRIFTPLEKEGYHKLVESMKYHLGIHTGSEFDETIRLADGSVQKVASFSELHAAYNEDRHNPKDGRLIKDCDLLAAFMEAHSSIHNGVASPHLLTAVVRLRSEISEKSVPALKFSALLEDFD